MAFFKFHLRCYGEFLCLWPALPFLNITKPAMVFLTLEVTRTQSVKIFFKCIFQISPLSLWRISMLVTRIAISKYDKTRNGFLDSRGHQDTVCEDFFLEKFVFQISPPLLWRISILATRITIPECYKTRNSFLDSGDYQEIV